jgi:hypothetical protein
MPIHPLTPPITPSSELITEVLPQVINPIHHTSLTSYLSLPKCGLTFIKDFFTNISIPKVTLPNMTLPKITLPNIITLPKLALPKLSFSNNPLSLVQNPKGIKIAVGVVALIYFGYWCQQRVWGRVNVKSDPANSEERGIKNKVNYALDKALNKLKPTTIHNNSQLSMKFKETLTTDSSSFDTLEQNVKNEYTSSITKFKGQTGTLPEPEIAQLLTTAYCLFKSDGNNLERSWKLCLNLVLHIYDKTKNKMPKELLPFMGNSTDKKPTEEDFKNLWGIIPSNHFISTCQRIWYDLDPNQPTISLPEIPGIEKGVHFTT